MEKGFTLIEVMFTLLIIGILVAVAVPVYKDVSASAQNRACFANQRTIEEAFQVFRGIHDRSPSSMQELYDESFIIKPPVCPSDGVVYGLKADGSTVKTTCRHGYYRD